MQLNFKREFSDIYSYLVERVRTFDPVSNSGPGVAGPVRMIHVGFEYGQSGWIVVVFDTRPDAEPDGEWNSHIDGQELARPNWAAAGDFLLKQAIGIVHLDDTEEILEPGMELAVQIGELIQRVLLQACADGVFDELLKTSGCEICIEHQSGAFGWLGDLKRSKTTGSGR